MAEKTVHIKMFDNIYRIIIPGYAKISGMADGTLVGLGKPMIDVVVGENCAAVIDTGYGEIDLKGYIKNNITDKPLICFNTHGHLDHTGGNAQFNEVYINRLDADAAKASAEMLCDRQCDEVRACPAPVYKPIDGGEIFDLGGRTLRAVPLPGHSAGSTGFVDSKSRVLFSGDAILKRIIINDVSGAEARKTFVSILKEDFAEILSGHWVWPLGRDQAERFIKLIDTATCDNLTVLTNNFGGRQVNSYMCSVGKDFYDPEFCAISFRDPEKFFNK